MLDSLLLLLDVVEIQAIELVGFYKAVNDKTDKLAKLLKCEVHSLTYETICT